jgi:cytochrome P450
VAVNTPIHLHIWSLQNTAREWDKPKEFIPDRWLSENQPADENKRASFPQCPFLAGDVSSYNGVGHTVDSLSFLPFSAGERSCLGKAFSLGILRRVLYRLHAEYRLDFFEPSWNEDYGVSQNAVVVPSSSKSTSMRVYRSEEMDPVLKEDGWADE